MIIVWALLFWSSTLHGAGMSWDCHGVLRPGDHNRAFELHLDRDARTARIVLADASWEIHPLTSEHDQHFFYDLLPGVQDERVETRRMFRFGQDRDLVYIDNDAGVFLLGQCNAK